MSEITHFLAQLLGVYLLVAGLSGLLRPERMKHAMDEVSKSYIVPYFDGALALITGLIVVLLHNVWDDLTTIIISAVGWLAVLEGVLMLLLPQGSIKALLKNFSTPRAVMIWSMVALVLGAYLTYVGFFA